MDGFRHLFVNCPFFWSIYAKVSTLQKPARSKGISLQKPARQQWRISRRSHFALPHGQAFAKYGRLFVIIHTKMSDEFFSFQISQRVF